MQSAKPATADTVQLTADNTGGTCCTLCVLSPERESERETLRGPETLHKLGLSLANLCLMSVPRNEVVSQANIIPSDSVAPTLWLRRQSW